MRISRLHEVPEAAGRGFMRYCVLSGWGEGQCVGRAENRRIARRPVRFNQVRRRGAMDLIDTPRYPPVIGPGEGATL